MPTVASDNPFVNGVFELCVWFLLFIGHVTGLSYNTVNVLVFCVLWPLLTVVLFVLAIRKTKKCAAVNYEESKENQV